MIGLNALRKALIEEHGDQLICKFMIFLFKLLTINSENISSYGYTLNIKLNFIIFAQSIE